MAKNYNVNILGLSKNAHQFEFQLSEEFFKKYGQEVVANGNLVAQVSLDKREAFIEADFTIKGTVNLICDRSLDEFDYPVSIHKKVVFKYGEVPQEVSDEIVIITPDQDKLDLGQFIYEFIALQIPMRKLHPRFNENEIKEGLIYTSTVKKEEETIDPRWEVLKKLNRK